MPRRSMSGRGLFGAGGDIAFVPEPASAALLLGDLGVLMLRRRQPE